MAAQAKSQITPASGRSIDMLLWILLALFLIPLALALQASPWAQVLPIWMVPTLMAGGLGIGIAQVVVPLRRWWSSLSALPWIAAAAVLGAGMSANAARGALPHLAVGATLLGGYLAGMCAMLPWLIYRARQAWVAIVTLWITLVGVWGGHAVTQVQIWETAWLLAISLGFLGLCRLRGEMQMWRRQRLEQLGPVVWPSARTIVTLSLVVAIIGLVPLGIAKVGALNRFWQRTPLGKGGPLSYDNPSGAPAAVLGAPLSLDAPDVSGNQVILSYNIALNDPTAGSGPQVTPPLLGATLDTFDGQTWSQSPILATPVMSQPLAAPAKAQTMTATIKLYNLPATENGSFLFGFDQPLGFSVPARVPTTSGGDPTTLTVADWQATQQLKQGMTYTVTSAIITPDMPASGTLPADLASRLTQVPSALSDTVHTLAVQWAGAAKTPVAQANALLDAMQKNLQYDPQAVPPKGQNGVIWFLTNKRGNLLLWTTAFILLGRSIGLPLRLAEGYQSGDYDDQLHAQVARASDASIWAQLAIPGAGWLDLYPAANIQTIITPGKIIYATPPPIPTIRPSPQPSPDTHHGNRNPYTGQTASQENGVLVISLALVAALLILIAAALAIVSWRWARFGQHLAPLARFFARIGLLARLAGVALRPSDTATQATGKVAAVMPRQQETLMTLNSAYERLTYGPPEGRNILINLREMWDRMRRDLWNLVIRRFWRRK